MGSAVHRCKLELTGYLLAKLELRKGGDRLMKYYHLSLIAFMISLSFISCHKCTHPANPDCGNYDPCYGQPEVIASFIIQPSDINLSQWIPYSTDTCRPGDVTFKALIDNATYDWRIGAGKYSTQSVELSFSGVSDGNIPITLIVRKKPNLHCNPFDDGVDTFTKNLVIKRNLCRVYGKFFGYFDDMPSQKFLIEIKRNYQSFPANSLFCADSQVLQTRGWLIPQSPYSYKFPCLDYASHRELIFNVQPPDSVLYTDKFVRYNTCVALIDSTFNKIKIQVYGDSLKPDGSNFYNSFGRTYIGTRQ